MPDQPTRRLPDNVPLARPEAPPTRRLAAPDGARPDPPVAARPDPAERPCPQCGAARFWAPVRAQGAYCLQVQAPHSGWRETLLTGVPETALEALVCRECGYTGLYAADPARVAPDRPH